jgi:hypothetical protein
VKLISQLPLTLDPGAQSALNLEITTPDKPGSFELPVIFPNRENLTTQITGKISN